MTNRSAAKAPKVTGDVPWSILIDGRTIPLTPSLLALLGIEAITGRTLFQHAEAASRRAVTLRDLALILRFLAGPSCELESVRGPMLIGGIDGRIGPIEQTCDEPAEAAIIRIGVVEVLAACMQPLMAALKGKVDQHGHLIPFSGGKG